MSETKGTVTALVGDYAFVSINGEGCGRCHEPGGCGGSNLSQMLCVSPKVYRVLNSGRATVGDSVIIVVGDRALFRSALVGYGLPLLGVFLGGFLGLKLAGELGSMIGAACGLLLSWCVQRLQLLRNCGIDRESEPRIK